MLGLLDKARAVLNFLLESLFLLGRTARSILETSRNLIMGRSEDEDQMEIIHGYWDPRNLCFIEESDTDQIELCEPAEGVRAQRPSRAAAASARGAGTSGTSCKTKKC
mgnify:CR=1 FL=1